VVMRRGSESTPLSRWCPTQTHAGVVLLLGSSVLFFSVGYALAGLFGLVPGGLGAGLAGFPVGQATTEMEGVREREIRKARGGGPPPPIDPGAGKDSTWLSSVGF